MKRSNVDILKNVLALLKRAEAVLARGASPEENAHVQDKIVEKEQSGTKAA